MLELKHYYPYTQIRNLYTYNKLQQLGWFTKWTLSIDYVKWSKVTKKCNFLAPFYKHIIVLFILYDNFMDRMIFSLLGQNPRLEQKNANFWIVYIKTWTILFNLRKNLLFLIVISQIVIFREIATERVCNYTKGKSRKQYFLLFKIDEC